MFNKLKQFKDLRSQAKTLQNAMSGETVTVEKNGVTVIMNGNLEITKISLNNDLNKDSLENILTDVTNDAIKKTQKLMARKMQEMGGLSGLGIG